jgi:hypothetical protein
MKNLFLILSVSLVSQTTLANAVLENCYNDRKAEFFVSELENVAQEKETPVLLLNTQNQVVGMITVNPERAEAYPHTASEVNVTSLRLCSSQLETDDFYYTDGPSENLLDWEGAEKDSVQITQDEGLIVLNVTNVSNLNYATKVTVSFKGYDVFSDDEDGETDYTEQDRKNPDFIDDWGLPKGKGEFYFYMPKEWKK